MEVILALALSRAWAFPVVKGDSEQWEDLSVGTGNPWEFHGLCSKKTRMRDDVFFLRTHVREWGAEAA